MLETIVDTVYSGWEYIVSRLAEITQCSRDIGRSHFAGENFYVYVRYTFLNKRYLRVRMDWNLLKLEHEVAEIIETTLLDARPYSLFKAGFKGRLVVKKARVD